MDRKELAKELGRLGGETTLKRHGLDHYSKMGKKGGRYSKITGKIADKNKGVPLDLHLPETEYDWDAKNDIEADKKVDK